MQGAIASGAGLERFRQIIEGQGGDPAVVDDYARMPAAPARHCVTAARGGFLAHVDAGLVGRASVALGAGRDRVDDRIDPAVGILLRARPGDDVRAGDPLLDICYRDRARLDAALPLIARAVHLADSRPEPKPLIVGEVS